MNLLAMLLTLGSLQFSLAGPVHPKENEGGVGVKNGGSAIQCPRFLGKLTMIEVFEAQTDPGAYVPEIENRAVFMTRIFNRLREVDTAESAYLTALLKIALDAHGLPESWPSSPFRVPTILREDDWSLSYVQSVDWINGTVYLKNGCIIIPISYLTPSRISFLPLPPHAIRENLASLDKFNRNVLELHEALYEVFLIRNNQLTVLPTRDLIRRLINSNTPPHLLEAQVGSFMSHHHLPPVRPTVPVETYRPITDPNL